MACFRHVDMFLEASSGVIMAPFVDSGCPCTFGNTALACPRTAFRCSGWLPPGTRVKLATLPQGDAPLESGCTIPQTMFSGLGGWRTMENHAKRTFPKMDPAKQADELQSILAVLSTSSAKRVELCPPKYRLAYARTLMGATGVSPRQAIRMKCYECVGFHSVADVIGSCTCRTCPLWHHRPFKDAPVP